MSDKKKPQEWGITTAFPDWGSNGQTSDLPPLPELKTAKHRSSAAEPPPWDVTRTWVATLSETRRSKLVESYQRHLKNAIKATDPEAAHRRKWLQHAIGLLQPREDASGKAGSVIVPHITAREAFVLPLLEKKGWSVLDWANESQLDYHTANDYLKDRTRPYASTRKKLAEGLGVEVALLPR